MIGANRSGKSSVFDAFACFQNVQKSDVNILGEDFINYYSKNKEEDFNLQISLWDKDELKVNKSVLNGAKPKYDVIIFGSGDLHKIRNTPEYQNIFYSRSSFRQISQLSRTALGQVNFNIEKDTDIPKFFVDKDAHFENDLEKITENILEEVFKGNQDSQTIQ